MLLDSWPNTQEGAEKAIQEHRQARRAAGATVDDVAPWSPDEIILATRARLPLLKGAVCAFKTGVLKLNRLLWPANRVPDEPDATAQVTTMLTVAPRRIRALLDSAARAGAQMTLATVVSWYPGLDLSLLRAVRAGSDSDLSAALGDISRHAADIGSWVDPLVYV